MHLLFWDDICIFLPVLVLKIDLWKCSSYKRKYSYQYLEKSIENVYFYLNYYYFLIFRYCITTYPYLKRAHNRGSHNRASHNRTSHNRVLEILKFESQIINLIFYFFFIKFPDHKSMGFWKIPIILEPCIIIL